MTIRAVVVTYNRKQLLLECLVALKKQTYPLNEIILIDNASTDGTYEFIESNGILDSKIIYKTLSENIGGAGGFYEGMKLAYSKGSDWIWIMDDDTIPSETALEELMDVAQKLPQPLAYMASSVFGINGEAMNVPTILNNSNEDSYADWYRYLNLGCVRISNATFVSLLINGKAVENCGLPCKDYFIWGDDTEYTLRITKNFGEAYLVGKSRVVHKRSAAKPIFITDETSENRMRMHYYFVRNSLINTREYNGRWACYRSIFVYLHVCWRILWKKDMKWLKIKTILRALKDYITKKYDYIAFKNRMKVDGQE